MEEGSGSSEKRITRRTPSAPCLTDIELNSFSPAATGAISTTTPASITTPTTTTTTTTSAGTLPTAIVSPSTSQLPMAGYHSPHSVLRNPFARVIAGTASTPTLAGTATTTSSESLT